MKKVFMALGFIPYILIVFLNAITDLGHKIVIQNTVFKSFDGSELIILTAIVNALILLPFILLFSPAGFISDKYPKTKVIQYASFAAIIITSLILLSYYLGWFWLAFVLTLILAAQSAIYSPAKYGLIKEMVGSEHLTQANAIVQAVTITSILLGAVIYSIVFENLLQDASSNPNEILTYIAPIGYLLIISSIIEFLLALRLPKIRETKEFMHFSVAKYRKMDYLKINLGIIRRKQTIWLCIIGLSVFWGVSQIVVALFGAFLKENMGIYNTVVAQGLLSLSGLGIIIGSLIVGRVSRHNIDTGIIPIGAAGITVMLFLLPQATDTVQAGVIIFFYGIASGLFIVPLNALIQFSSPGNILGKVLAGNNFIQNITMFSFLCVTVLFAFIEIPSQILMNLVALIAFIGTLYTVIKLPQSLVRYLIKSIIALKYRVSVYGMDNINTDRGTLLLGNHISFLDWAILQIAYPEQIRFVMERGYYNRWYFKPFLKFFGAIPVSSAGSKQALTQIAAALQKGETVALFPEGHISRNGQLGAFQRGFEVALKEVEDCIIIPFYLRGLWESEFSYASSKVKRSQKKEISVTFGQPMSSSSSAQEVKEQIFQLSITAWQNYAESLAVIPKLFIQRSKEAGNKLCIADSMGTELSYTRFLTATLLMAKKFKSRIATQQNIGLLVPTSAAGAMANMATLCLGKTIVNLNYTTALPGLLAAVEKAEIKTIITSEKFIKKLAQKGFELEELLADMDVIYLEQIKGQISVREMVFQLLQVKFFPTFLLNWFYTPKITIEDTAAILFSSGSEGTPKGIELSHKNINGNIKQIITVLNPSDNDVMMATLPIFHSFGLTVTTLLPLLEGIPTICHPDPTDAFAIGKLAAKYEGTILCGTSTFLRLYTRNRKLNPLMFANMRLVIAGAEKLSPEVRDSFKNKFGLDIYEGYGATETTPVASVNVPDILMQDSWRVQSGSKQGSVGLALPGSSFRIVDPNSYEMLPAGESGMILIGGTQIMKGYLKDPDKTESVIKELDGIRWYVTGDKGYLDEHGFLTIVDRYSRFAKIGGDMVSLGAVEEQISSILSDETEVMAVAITDSKKGEQIVLLYSGAIDPQELKQQLLNAKLNSLFLPSQFFLVEELPKLGTGKADFSKAKNLAEKLVKL